MMREGESKLWKLLEKKNNILILIYFYLVRVLPSPFLASSPKQFETFSFHKPETLEIIIFDKICLVHDELTKFQFLTNDCGCNPNHQLIPSRPTSIVLTILF